MKELLQQLGLNSTLLPDDVATAILAGNTPPIEEILINVLIAVQDAHAVIVGDPKSTWNEKRLARMALAVAFLAAMTVLGQGEA